MVVDALGNEIIIGKSYGYILKNKWESCSVHGIIEKINEKTKNVTMGSVKSKNYKRADSVFEDEERKRSVYSGFLFPINL